MESLKVARSKAPPILRKKVNKQFLDGAHSNFSSVIWNMQDKNLHPQKLQVKNGLFPFIPIHVKIIQIKGIFLLISLAILIVYQIL